VFLTYFPVVSASICADQPFCHSTLYSKYIFLNSVSLLGLFVELLKKAPSDKMTRFGAHSFAFALWRDSPATELIAVVDTLR
jgi:hypothetical protein